MPDVNAIAAKLAQHGQSHLLRFYDELPPARQAALLNQIEQIDLDELGRLVAQYVLAAPAAAIEGEIEPAPVVSARTGGDRIAAELSAARLRGQELIAAGKVAAFVVAGGQGTRLGFDGPKGCFQATPVAHKPLFQVFAEQILAASRRSGKAIPWYIMTSPLNDAATQAFFRQQNYFGLDGADVFFLVQGTMPAISLGCPGGPAAGKLLLEQRDALATSPNGHGGAMTALRQSGALDDMARRGIELISYFQVDNPLVRVIDPLLLGLHHLRGAEASAKSLPKRDPMEKVGNFCLVDGKVSVIEYSDMPDELARATMPDGRLLYGAGSIAIHAFSRTFVERLTAGGRTMLPFHRADKKVPFLDAAGRRVEPERPNAVKLEMFIFDALPLARQTVILETDRSEEFSPIKNATGLDSPATSLHDQVRRAAAWLDAAGVSVPRDADGQVAAAIEISPLYADSPEALAGRVDPKLAIAPGQSLYLAP
ncbi:MAG: UDPGP type 1 family protein [Planctomycetaceae bacterium]|nr:UDPGP type 1 family protein [Planctomycetaceae bacterium]